MSTEFDQPHLDMSFLIETFDAPPHPEALSGVLFAEDFDVDGAHHDATDPDSAVPTHVAPEPPPIYDEAQLHASRLLGFEDGRAAAMLEAGARARLAEEEALGALARCLDQAKDAAEVVARDAASALSTTMLRLLATALPELCARHGPAEAVALAETLLPMLIQQPRIVLRANPHTLPMLEATATRHAGDDPARIRLVATDALAEGDLTIDWQDGTAIRDTTVLYRDFAAMLGPLVGTMADHPPPRDTPDPARGAEQELLNG